MLCVSDFSGQDFDLCDVELLNSNLAFGCTHPVVQTTFQLLVQSPVYCLLSRAVIRSTTSDGAEDSSAKKAVDEIKDSLLRMMPEDVWSGEAGLYISDEILEEEVRTGPLVKLVKLQHL